ncbi:helix-turn-helix transcriptional regulator [Spirochaetes bacterium]|uniref:Helix-turn-helix transcriptional regulator n=1 Tax=Candidatus Scatousia excrementipullorum TaxID=2840936 RepID=A0A9D9DPZ3_9BACT|nr:helix-turn-helix transcriptional regulator [Candidatus Scatousia excrementipullorum]
MNGSRKLIGQKIKEIRKRNGITQETFSEIIGIEPSSLSNIENGKSFPSMQTILKIMEKFNAKPQDFFNFEYLKDEESLEEEIIEIIKRQPYDKKQIIFRIIKQFAV